MVGVLEWKDPSVDRFPKEGRRDLELARLFEDRGVPRAQIVFLRDEEATLARIRKELSDFLPKVRGTLFVYYAGHGVKDDAGRTYFLPYDSEDAIETSGWSIPSLFDDLEKHAGGAQAILAADCCYSGALADEARKRKVRAACLASSRSSAESTGRWTFTEQLLAGFRGDPRLDLDGDRKVRLEELARDTELEMAFREEQLSSFHAAGVPPALALAAAPPKVHPRIGERLEAKRKEKWRRASIVEMDGARARVRYAGRGPEEGEWVEAHRLRPWTPAHRAAGEHVEVKWRKTWYPARILEGKLGVHRIHYEGFGDEWDEWVSSDRLRPRREE
jgi:hypothetical protein